MKILSALLVLSIIGLCQCSTYVNIYSGPSCNAPINTVISTQVGYCYTDGGSFISLQCDNKYNRVVFNYYSDSGCQNFETNYMVNYNQCYSAGAVANCSSSIPTFAEATTVNATFGNCQTNNAPARAITTFLDTCFQNYNGYYSYQTCNSTTLSVGFFGSPSVSGSASASTAGTSSGSQTSGSWTSGGTSSSSTSGTGAATGQTGFISGSTVHNTIGQFGDESELFGSSTQSQCDSVYNYANSYIKLGSNVCQSHKTVTLCFDYSDEDI
ncbi:cysteine protease 4 [Tieghemostelium lacteum]|uniref:Cysteine protease 4 n=1 Tax=Tieghemostelium lacteum TaxID=361077 RepID=A0A151ZFI3_TIELA|nr:cysteine protease 4 [Tieghemostelium lacteum]|eukprot:KYQ92687.1 cysteine protease 4 [Tieghemostelium lacteum]